MGAWAYIPEIAYFLFNFPTRRAARGRTPREHVAALLRAKMWAVHPAEPHCAALAVGDLVLIYIGLPESAFVGRAGLASAVRDWSPAEARVHPFGAEGGVLLEDVEEWDPPVPMDAVVARVDPTGTNPYVQANAGEGFKNGVVLITEGEYEGVLVVRAEKPR